MIRCVPVFVLLLTVVAQADITTAPIGNRTEVLQQPFLLGSWTQLEQIYPTRMVARGGAVNALPEAPSDLSDLTYRHAGKRYTVAKYLERNDVTSLLVIKDGQIVFERYRMGTGPQTRFTSWSIAKSVTSTLLGIALDRGLVDSVDDLASDYVPELAASAYGNVSLRDLLQMTSGVKFVEDYAAPESKEVQAWVLAVAEQRLPYNDTILWFDEKLREPGEAFYYASIETQVIGWVLRRATGKPLASLLSEWIWQHIGAEHDASWLLDRPGGMEVASCCLNATTRDYARFGLAMLGDDSDVTKPIVPPNWVRTATRPDPMRPFLHRGELREGFGYQHFWWLWPDSNAYAARGFGGQWLFIDPDEALVIVQTAIYNADSVGDDWPETVALFAAARAALR
ncbi:MAG: serine hydrolase [Pseudomonadota bacterium]